MRKDKFVSLVITVIDNMAGSVPTAEEQAENPSLRSMFRDLDNLFNVVSTYRNDIDMAGVPGTRDRHVGESNYSAKEIQPWDIWIEYGLPPWDADIVKRIIRTKAVPGLTPKEARLQDYSKIQHICEERKDQINNGDPYYKNIVIPPWVESDV